MKTLKTCAMGLCNLLLLGLAACGTSPADEPAPADAGPEDIGSIEEALSLGNHGFAWVALNTGTGVWAVQNNFSFSSGGPFPTVVREATGRYRVTFSGLSTAYSGPGNGGNVQIVATNQAGTGGVYNATRCKSAGWGSPPSQDVYVQCHDATGAAADSPFIAHYVQIRSISAGKSGYVWTSGNPTSPAPYNPDPAWSGNMTGGLNTVQRTAVGAYTVTFGGLAAPLCGVYPPCYGGNPQVTAYDFLGSPTPGYCKIRSFAPSGADEVVQVQCYDASGNPADSRFSLNFDHRPSSPFGIGAHTFASNATSPSYTPDPAYSYNSDAFGFGEGTNLALRQSQGVYQMRHFELQNNKAAPFVVAHGLDNRHCKIEKWGLIPGLNTDVQVETRCYNPAGGAPRDSQYLETFVSRRKPMAPADADGDGYTTSEGDCNDANPGVNPGVPEVCNHLDEDCDAVIDDGVCIPSAVAVGNFHTCALLEAGRVKCWGNNASGQLGLGNTANRGDGAGEMGPNLPFIDLGTGLTATTIAAGGLHTCAVLNNGQVKCWGSNALGQLGQGDTVQRGDGAGEMGDSLPIVSLGSGLTATAIAAGDGYTCVRLNNAQIKCWGANGFGQLGLGDVANRGDGAGEMGNSLPVVSLGSGVNATAIAAGAWTTCALLNTGLPKCWGRNTFGQLGLGDVANRGDGPSEMGNFLPAIDLGTSTTALALTGGDDHTCARLNFDDLKCWGDSINGQVGLGDTLTYGDNPGEMGDNLLNVDLGTGRTATAIGAGFAHSCALLDTAQVKCWGDNLFGELGQGDTTNRGDGLGAMGDALPAVDLGTGLAATAIEGGGAHNCAILNNGQLKCWGDNFYGQLGLGNTLGRGDGPGEMGDSLPPVDL